MPDKPALKMRSKQALGQKQTQSLMMSNKMQQALHILQLPVMEIELAIEQELEANPVLEVMEDEPHDIEDTEAEERVEEELSFDDKDLEIMKRLDEDFKDLFAESGEFYKKRDSEEEKRQTFLEQSIREESSLFEHLMHQAAKSLSKEEMQAAEILIGSLNERGFLESSLEEIAEFHGQDKNVLEKILIKIQDFDPPGVGASSLQESLLLQLRRQLKENTLAYFIVDGHFEDLTHNRLPQISKKLHCTSEEIEEAVEKHIGKLSLSPGSSCSASKIQTIVPDVKIYEEGGALVVDVMRDYLPSLRLNSKYLKMLEQPDLSKEDKEFIKEKVLSAKWLMKNLLSRNDTVERIAEEIAKRQTQFFLDPKGELVPLQMKSIAEELSLNESTIARAIANKYVDTPRGILPLRSFFSGAYETATGEVSQSEVQNVLKGLIEGEDKKHPLTDQALCDKIQETGITVARRTVAKLRGELKIGNTRERRRF